MFIKKYSSHFVGLFKLSALDACKNYIAQLIDNTYLDYSKYNLEKVNHTGFY